MCPAATSGLAAHLQAFLWCLSVDGDKDVLLRRVLRYMREARVTGAAVLLFMFASLADVVLAESSEAARLPLRAFLGGYSSFVAHLMLAQKTGAAIKALRLAISVAVEVEREATLDVKALLEGEARVAVRRTRVLVAYALLTQVFVVLTLAADTDSATTRLLYEHLGAAARWCALLVLVYGIMCCHNCLYTLLLMQMSLHQACTALYLQLGARLKAQRGAAHTSRSLEMHGRVTESCRLLSDVFGHKLPHFHTVGLLLPMVSTVEVILSVGRTDMFALAMVPLLFIFFVPQCVAGQRLEDSSEAVGWGAYQGPWLAEDTTSRRFRLQAIQRTARPACFGVPGMVSLNHRSCERALRTWFQYLQILLNTSHRKGFAH